MMKSEFFKLLLHQNYANDINMAKKKKAKSEKRDSSFTSIIGIKNIFQNEKLNFVIGSSRSISSWRSYPISRQALPTRV